MSEDRGLGRGWFSEIHLRNGQNVPNIFYFVKVVLSINIIERVPGIDTAGD